MCASTQTKAGRWKQLFLFAEICAVVGLIYGAVLSIAWRYDVGEHPHIVAAYRILFPMLIPVFCGFLAACVFLMVASPFFLRSLRGVAIRAWIVGVAALLCAGLFFVIR
jgi:hypothetical protein